MRTKLDNYLIEKGTLYRCSVRSLPRQLPAGIKIEPIESAKSGNVWRYYLTIAGLEGYHTLLALLRSERMLWEATILTRTGWSWAMRPGSRSMEGLWFLLSASLSAVAFAFGFGWVKQLTKLGVPAALLARM